jgi:hypothetical protein
VAPRTGDGAVRRLSLPASKFFGSIAERPHARGYMSFERGAS